VTQYQLCPVEQEANGEENEEERVSYGGMEEQKTTGRAQRAQRAQKEETDPHLKRDLSTVHDEIVRDKVLQEEERERDRGRTELQFSQESVWVRC
jgi:hypothetical protein